MHLLGAMPAHETKHVSGELCPVPRFRSVLHFQSFDVLLEGAPDHWLWHMLQSCCILPSRTLKLVNAPLRPRSRSSGEAALEFPDPFPGLHRERWQPLVRDSGQWHGWKATAVK